MIDLRKFLLWTGAMLSLPAAFYAGASFVFYAWLNAAEPEHWPPERAAPWAYGSLIVAIGLIVLFVFCAIRLAKKAESD
jgi:amino acid transporter